MLKKISYSREGEFLTNPNKDYKALNLTEISQFMDDLLNQFANDEIRLEQELINDSIPESIEPESEPEQTENIPDITKDQRIELYRFMSDIEDQLYQLYDDNSYYFDSKFTLNNNEITVDNSSNLFISMENIDSYYSISCGIKNKFYTKLTLNKDKLEIIKNDSEISIDEFKELFNQVYYSLDNYFMFKMEALWKKTGNLKDLIKASI